MRFKVFLFLSLLFVVAKAANNPTKLIIRAKDNTRVAYALSERPKVSFNDSTMIISLRGAEIDYSLKNIESIMYGDISNTVNDIRDHNRPLEISEEALLFPDLKKNDIVSVYTVNGILLSKLTAKNDGEYALPLSDFKAGTYLIAVNGITYKIIIQ